MSKTSPVSCKLVFAQADRNISAIQRQTIQVVHCIVGTLQTNGHRVPTEEVWTDLFVVVINKTEALRTKRQNNKYPRPPSLLIVNHRHRYNLAVLFKKRPVRDVNTTNFARNCQERADIQEWVKQEGIYQVQTGQSRDPRIRLKDEANIPFGTGWLHNLYTIPRK
eukprot:766135-Hanusia_phi.AAC.1